MKIFYMFMMLSFFLCAFLIPFSVIGQKNTQFSAIDSLLVLNELDPDRIEEEAYKTYSFIERRLKTANEKFLSQFEKQQEKMRKRLMKMDSSKALLLFNNAEGKLQMTSTRIGQATEKATSVMQQFSAVDELNISAGFIRKIRAGSSGLVTGMGKLKELKIKLAGLHNEMERAEVIKQYINERQQLLKEQLGGFNMGKHFDRINHQASAYRQLIKDYRQILNEPGRLEQLATEKLRKIPAFNDFFSRHSALASLFPQKSEIVNVSQGMQTVETAGLLLSNRLSGGAEGVVQAVTGQIQQIQKSFNDLLRKSTGNANTLEMPGYGPEKLKSKTFLQRIELGANVQFIRPRGIFPQTADVALQAGYKFSKKGTVGFGIAYRLGMGQGFDKINFTSEGLGIRSFADFKLKGNIFINGGFEQNYNSSFKQFEELKNNGSWTGSALLGLSKKIKGPKKLTSNIQLLYNFLHRNTVPGSQPILFRTGFNF